MPDDKTLVRAVIGGDQAAYEKLYDRYAPLVRAICYDTTRNLIPGFPVASRQPIAIILPVRDPSQREYYESEKPLDFGGGQAVIGDL